MTAPFEESGNEAQHRRWPKKFLAVVVVCVVALVIWGVIQSMGRTSTAAEISPTSAGTNGPPSAVATPTTKAAPSSAATDAPGESSAPESPAPEPVAEPTAAPAPTPEPTPLPEQELPGEPSLSDDAALAEIPQAVASPVPLDDAAAVKSGLDAKVTNMAAVDGEANGIGEIAGPAIRFSVEVTNDTDADVSTNSVVVSLEYGKDATPAGQLSGPDIADFPPVISKGKTATATYVFNVPVADRGLVRILLSVDASLPIAAFEGAL